MDAENRCLNEKLLGVAVVLFGLLYIPAFIYGYFWLWVFPFTAITTLFMREKMFVAHNQVADIDDLKKKSKVATFRFLKINIAIGVLGAAPFILALWLLHFGYIDNSGISSIDQYLFESVLYFTPSPSASHIVETTKYYVGYIQVLCGCAFYMFLSFVSLTGFSFRQTSNVMKAMCNKDHSEELKEYSHYESHLNAEKYQDAFHFIFLIVLFVIYIASINEFMKVEYTADVLSVFCLICELTSLTFSNLLIGGVATRFKSIEW